MTFEEVVDQARAALATAVTRDRTKVYIRAVGIKERNRIRIAGVIFEL